MQELPAHLFAAAGLLIFIIPIAFLPQASIAAFGVVVPLVIGAAVAHTSASIVVFGVFIAISCTIFFVWIFGRILADLNELFKSGNIAWQQVTKALFRAISYSVPALLLVWMSFDFAEITERQAMYGCSADGFPEASLYGVRSEDNILHGRPERQADSTDIKYLLSYRKAAPLEWLPRYTEGPVFWIASGVRLVADRGPEIYCPRPISPADHETSATETVTQITANLKVELDKKFDKFKEDAELKTKDGEALLRRHVFGSPNHGCRANDRGVLPDDGECLIGRLPRSCGLWRWIRRTGECIERKVKKPIIRTYENWQSKTYQDYLATYAEIERKSEEFDDISDEFLADIQKDLDKAAETTNFNIRLGFWLWAIAGWIGMIFAVSFIAKTFLTLLSRSVFSDEAIARGEMGDESKTEGAPAKHGTAAKITLLDPDDDRGLRPIDLSQQVKSVADQTRSDGSGFRSLNLSVPADKSSKSVWYAYDNCGVTWAKYGRAYLFFRMKQVWLRRLRAGKAVVHRLEEVGNLGEIGGRIRHDAAVIEVTLRADQEAIIDLNKLLAFQSSVRFETRLLPRLGAFFQKRLLYTVVRLDENQKSGRILFVGEGRALGAVSAGAADAFVAPDSVALMDICGSYHGAASLRGLSPYYRPVTVGPADEATVLLASNGHGDAAFGLLARLRGMVWFLLPV